MSPERRSSTWRGPLHAANETASNTFQGERRGRRERMDMGQKFFRIASDLLDNYPKTYNTPGKPPRFLTEPITLVTARGHVVTFLERIYNAPNSETVQLSLSYEDGTTDNLKLTSDDEKISVASLPPTDQLRKGVNVLYLLQEEYRRKAQEKVLKENYELKQQIERGNYPLPSVASVISS